MKKLLIVDDDIDLCLLLNLYLTRKGFKVSEAHSSKEALRFIEYNPPDLVVCDIRLQDMDGITLMKIVKDNLPDIPFVFITAYDDIKTSSRAMSLGALDYITKPLLPEEVTLSIQKILDKNLVHEPFVKNICVEETNNLQEIVFGDSGFSLNLLKKINLIAPTNHSLIIHGEKGTGKEAIAREIHRRSNRADKPFVVFKTRNFANNITAADLLVQVKNHVESSQTGTLYIDELADLPQDVLLILLKYLQEKTMRKTDDSKDIMLDIRFMAASCENLWHATHNSKLLEDLYLRLNDFSIEVTPLRKRKEDILFFAKHFLDIANIATGKEVKGFTPEVETILMNQLWKENLSELKNLVYKAVLLTSTQLIEASSIPKEIYLAVKNVSAPTLGRSRFFFN